MSSEKPSLQKIMELGYPAYERGHALPDFVRRAVRAILACRTFLLGGHVQACPDGHFERVWYNSCKHRMCPLCAFLQVERWLCQWKARLLGCDHYHVIFTLPHELNDLWLANVEAMTEIFFSCVRETLFEMLGDSRHLGARPGFIATLQTWSQTLILHPHIHCLITGGGLSDTGQWIAVRNGFLLPSRAVMKKFRGKLSDTLQKALDQGKLTPAGAKSRQQWKNQINRLSQKKWDVYISERYPHGEGVLIYLARYLRGGPISNYRLISCDEKEVTFWYEERPKEKGGQAKRETMTLPIDQFIQRFLLHVPSPGAIRVRSWGLYSHAKAGDLARCREQLGQLPMEVHELLDWQSYCARRGEEHPERCPVCGQLLIFKALIPRAGAPPPTETASGEAA